MIEASFLNRHKEKSSMNSQLIKFFMQSDASYFINQRNTCSTNLFKPKKESLNSKYYFKDSWVVF